MKMNEYFKVQYKGLFLKCREDSILMPLMMVSFQGKKASVRVSELRRTRRKLDMILRMQEAKINSFKTTGSENDLKAFKKEIIIPC